MELLSESDKYGIYEGDCIPHMATMPSASVDFAVFSPPFPSLFAYTDEPCDIGNSDDVRVESKIHLSYFYRQIGRVIKPGRCVVVHVMQIPGLARNGEVGTFDFRGLNIRLGERAGLHYQYDWLVTKNPQGQAIRTHSHKLLFVTLERDRAKSCGAMGDYLIKFIAPGENVTPVDSSEITRDEWINWAEGVWPWRQVRETDTLNTGAAKGENDTKHICPLQLGVIERLVKLYTNPGELVFSPFAGIGSEGYMALKLGRRFYGCEIKAEYIAAMRKNLERALTLKAESERTLWNTVDAQEGKPGREAGVTSVSFSIPYVCGPKQGGGRPGGRGKRFTDPKVKDDAATLASLVLPYRPAKPLQGPLLLQVMVRYPWRKSESKKRRQRKRRWKDTAPDNENILKQLDDVLEKLGFMGNDGQIACIVFDKCWTDNGGMDVTLRELEEAL